MFLVDLFRKEKVAVFVQIPCLNERDSIGEVLSEIPKSLQIEGKKIEIKTVVIDDGSTDETVAVAKKAGVDFVVQHGRKKGLADAFRTGIEFCLSKGADIIVNTDGDNQYNQQQIGDLLVPIVKDGADMVIGDRQVAGLDHMPWGKRYGNRLGSAMIRWLTKLPVQDASSGFRAFSREAALQLGLLSTHTYTHETIIQAKAKGLEVVSVPIEFKKRAHGESRLIGGIWAHVQKSGATIVRSILMYQAFGYLLVIGLVLLVAGIGLGVRFLFFFLEGEGDGHIQSLILSSILINLGVITMALGVIADLIATNRKLLEDVSVRLKRRDYERSG